MRDSSLLIEEICIVLVVEFKMISFARAYAAKEVAIRRSLLPRTFRYSTAQILLVQSFDYISDSKTAKMFSVCNYFNRFCEGLSIFN